MQRGGQIQLVEFSEFKKVDKFVGLTLIEEPDGGENGGAIAGLKFDLNILVYSGATNPGFAYGHCLDFVPSCIHTRDDLPDITDLEDNRISIDTLYYAMMTDLPMTIPIYPPSLSRREPKLASLLREALSQFSLKEISQFKPHFNFESIQGISNVRNSVFEFI